MILNIFTEVFTLVKRREIETGIKSPLSDILWTSITSHHWNRNLTRNDFLVRDYTLDGVRTKRGSLTEKKYKSCFDYNSVNGKDVFDRRFLMCMYIIIHLIHSLVFLLIHL